MKRENKNKNFENKVSIFTNFNSNLKNEHVSTLDRGANEKAQDNYNDKSNKNENFILYQRIGKNIIYSPINKKDNEIVSFEENSSNFNNSDIIKNDNLSFYDSKEKNHFLCDNSYLISNKRYILNSLKNFNPQVFTKANETNDMYNLYWIKSKPQNLNISPRKNKKDKNEKEFVSNKPIFSRVISSLYQNSRKNFDNNNNSSIIINQDKTKVEQMKLETIHEQKFNLSKNYLSSNKNDKYNVIRRNQSLSYNINLNYIRRIILGSRDIESLRINNINKKDSNISSFINKPEKRGSISVILNNEKNFSLKRYKSENKISDFLKGSEFFNLEKILNDQILYSIRKNINELGLNNPFLGGKRKGDKKFNYRKKDYSVKKSIGNILRVSSSITSSNANIIVNNILIDQGHFQREKIVKSQTKKKKFIKIKNEFKRQNYSFNCGNIHKNYSLINLNYNKKEEKNARNNINVNKTDSRNIEPLGSLVINTLDPIAKTEVEAQFNTMETIRKDFNTSDFNNISFDSNKFDFDYENQLVNNNNNNIGSSSFNFNTDYFNTLSSDILTKNIIPMTFNSKTTPNNEYINLILNTNDSGSNSNNKNNCDNTSKTIDINTNFAIAKTTDVSVNNSQVQKKNVLLFKNYDKSETKNINNSNNITDNGLISGFNNNKNVKSIPIKSINSIINLNKSVQDKVYGKLRENVEISNNYDMEKHSNFLNGDKNNIKHDNATNKNSNINKSKSNNPITTENIKKSPNCKINKNKNETKSNLNKIKNDIDSIDYNIDTDRNSYYINTNGKYENKRSTKKILYTQNKDENNFEEYNQEICENINLENLDNSKIDTKSCFSYKLFSEHSFDDGIREQILSSSSFFGNTKTNININVSSIKNKPKESEQISNYSWNNNSRLLYSPIEKSIESKLLKFLQKNPENFLKKHSSNPVLYNLDEGEMLLKVNQNNKKEKKIINNKSINIHNKNYRYNDYKNDFDINNNKNNSISHEFKEAFNGSNKKQNREQIKDNNSYINNDYSSNKNEIYSHDNTKKEQKSNLKNIYLKDIKKNYSSALIDPVIKPNIITNINYDFMREYYNIKESKAKCLIKDDYYFENFINMHRKTNINNLEFIENIKNESDKSNVQKYINSRRENFILYNQDLKLKNKNNISNNIQNHFPISPNSNPTFEDDRSKENNCISNINNTKTENIQKLFPVQDKKYQRNKFNFPQQKSLITKKILNYDLISTDKGNLNNVKLKEYNKIDNDYFYNADEDCPKLINSEYNNKLNDNKNNHLMNNKDRSKEENITDVIVPSPDLSNKKKIIDCNHLMNINSTSFQNNVNKNLKKGITPAVDLLFTEKIVSSNNNYSDKNCHINANKNKNLSNADKSDSKLKCYGSFIFSQSSSKKDQIFNNLSYSNFHQRNLPNYAFENNPIYKNEKSDIKRLKTLKDSIDTDNSQYYNPYNNYKDNFNQHYSNKNNHKYFLILNSGNVRLTQNSALENISYPIQRQNSIANVNLSLDEFPKNQIIEKLHSLRLFPKLVEKYFHKINPNNIFSNNDGNQNINYYLNNDLNLKEIESKATKVQRFFKNIQNKDNIIDTIKNHEFIDNSIKQKIKPNKILLSEFIPRSPTIGRYFSKIKKNY